MSDIVRSVEAGRIPTVNQLVASKTGIGYNLGDACLYGLKINGTTKTVELLNGTGQGTSYTHPGYTPITLSLSGATVLASLSTDAIGSVTAATTRTLTLSDLGYSAPAILWTRQTNQGISVLWPSYSTSDNIQNTGYIGSGNVGSNDGSFLNKGLITISSLNSYPELQTNKWIIGGGDVLRNIDLFKQNMYANTHLFAAIKFRSATTVDWSTNNYPSELYIDTTLRSQSSPSNRIHIDDLGLINVFNGISVQSPSTWGKETVKIEQLDEDKAFVHYAGTTATDASKNISTMNGDGNLNGPQSAVATPGWAFAGMTRDVVNNTDVWRPYYIYENIPS